MNCTVSVKMSTNKQDHRLPAIEPTSETSGDKRFNINDYATRKSFVQGMLDLALLTANAAQLKYILAVGEIHQFYTLLLVLIITSISLQILQAIIIVVLGMLLNINKIEEQRKSDIINNILICVTVVTVVINIVISSFDMKNQSLIKA
ncbi:ninjurin-2-like [Topomyia yanbarensis]|uniref:ninjurin-2-like n=1 Tax=Topomyia yanbarensis TaxID=2498891 RepID=UPI00273C5490|nr:ninjurin-2-like [Topomyia yanbarensis]